MRRSILGSAVGVIVLALAGTAWGATAESFTVFNPCTGEDVAIEATPRVTEREMHDGFVVAINWRDATAIGTTSGSRYVFTSSPTVLHVSGTQFTTTDRLTLVAPGGQGVLLFHTTYHFTELDGALIVEIDATWSACRG